MFFFLFFFLLQHVCAIKRFDGRGNKRCVCVCVKCRGRINVILLEKNDNIVMGGRDCFAPRRENNNLRIYSAKYD